jgi:Ca-activated chloride channel family protein
VTGTGRHPPVPSGDRDRVLVLVTDGQVGNEDQILAELSPRLAGIRVHTVGVDQAVNEAFLQRLAGLTGGRCELVESEDRLDDAMQHIHRRIATPIVTGLRVTSGSLTVDPATLAPRPLPDLFAGAPVVIGGRFTGPPTGTLTVTGNDWGTTVAATPSDNSALGAVWARARVRDLEDQYVLGRGTADAIVETSLRHGVLSRFTAFVTVDDEVVNAAGGLHQVTQPVAYPSGWQGAAYGHQGGPVAAAAPARRTAPAAASPRALPGYQGGGPGYGGAPGHHGGAQDFVDVPEFAKAPPPPAPEPTAAPEPKSIAEVAAEQLWWLRSPADNAHTSLLTALAERIRALQNHWATTGERESARNALADLATELSTPTTDPAEIERRWQHAITVLERLIQERPKRRAFWKR